MLCRDFVLYGLLASFLGASYANFGTKSCATGFSEDATWGEDQTYDAVDASAAEFPNAASIRVVRWKCNCDKYVDSTATTGDCVYESNKLGNDGTNSPITVEFVDSLGYYNFNAWSPSPRTGKNQQETERRLYHFWSAHQAERSTDVQAAEEELARRRERAKFGKLDDASELLQLKGGAGAGVASACATPATKLASKSATCVNAVPDEATCATVASATSGLSWDGSRDWDDRQPGCLSDANGGDVNWNTNTNGQAENDGFVSVCCNDPNYPTPPPTPSPTATPGHCFSGPCTQNRKGDMHIPDGTLPSAGYINQRTLTTFHNGDPLPGDGDKWVDESCTGSNDKYCADWTIPSGCEMLTSSDLLNRETTPGKNAQARFNELVQASAAGSDCSGTTFTVDQFWSASGIPVNGDTCGSVNTFMVPFHQKWNAYYLAVRESPEQDRNNRFQVAAQVLSCADGSVTSQVFSRGNQAVWPAEGMTGFCNGAVSWATADGMWRQIIGEIHAKIRLG